MRLFSIVAICALLPVVANASDCWVAGEFEGRSTMSTGGYNFIEDSFADGMLICFSGDVGRVTGNDLPLTQFGASTLIGWSENGQGLETVNTCQLDRERGRLLITQSRIGTATEVPILPDYAAVYVGRTVPASQ
ncbi:hypothetical protein [Parvibaculum sp.]|uniref:hypothetical protein n=1 Tax=Parvibaculum sp. TaxID=2024848 RepID=UPI001D2FAB1A|nr:hypothetical protein [Parvibaculum sp.]MBX3487936.1 hypothetical protein [Parvibaculum sp.]MCW5728070.1 hypothetical protein [Parvibaculum sp.]